MAQMKEISEDWAGHKRPGQRPEQRPGTHAETSLGPPLDIRAAAELIGCSPWTVRQRLIPKGMPFFRAAASGKLIFYTNQIIRWIEKQQSKGGF